MTSILYRSTFLLGALSFFGLIVWAFQTGSFWPEVSDVASKPWGQVMLADLYIGFFVFGVFLFKIERKMWVGFFWFAALCVLGNGVALVYLLFRFDRIEAHFKETA